MYARAQAVIAMWFKGIPKEWIFAVTFKHFTAAEKRTVVLEYVAIFVTRALLLIYCADLGVTLVTLALGYIIGNAVLTTLFAWIVHHPHSEQEQAPDPKAEGPRRSKDAERSEGKGRRETAETGGRADGGRTDEQETRRAGGRAGRAGRKGGRRPGQRQTDRRASEQADKRADEQTKA